MFVVALFGASQDIVIDAYRRELLADDELGTGTSIFVNAYRSFGLVPGSLALILARLPALDGGVLGHRRLHAGRHHHHLDHQGSER